MTGDDWYKARVALDMTQKELAVAMGVSVRTIGYWEHDRPAPPIAKALIAYMLRERRQWDALAGAQAKR